MKSLAKINPPPQPADFAAQRKITVAHQAVANVTKVATIAIASKTTAAVKLK